MMDTEKLRAEILAQYLQVMEPIERETNERMARAKTSERRAEIYREFMDGTAPIRDSFAKHLACLPPAPIIISNADNPVGDGD